MLTVQTNTAAITALKNININSTHMNQSLNRLSSGFRVNSAADDAAGYAVSSKLSGQVAKLKAASLNAVQAQAMVKMADAGVNEIQNMVVRLQTLAIQGASANNSTDLARIKDEATKLESAINKIAGGTKYNGTTLLGGTSSTFQVGATNNANDQVVVDFSKGYSTSSSDLSITAASTAFATAISSQTMITTMDSALTTLVTQRANLGSASNQLGFINANLATGIEQTRASVSAIKDADMAAEMASFTKNKILTQAGTSMLAQANQAAQNVLTLFR